MITFDIPWVEDAEWREINSSFRHLIAVNRGGLARTHHHAERIRTELTRLFPLMHTLCAETCPACREPCCRVAKLWYNFQDLLFLHAIGQKPPQGQPLTHYHALCRYLGAQGCRLPRLARPWICTWYLCPPQTRLLRKMGAARNAAVQQGMERIRQDRKEMEACFIRETSPKG